MFGLVKDISNWKESKPRIYLWEKEYKNFVSRFLVIQNDSDNSLLRYVLFHLLTAF